MNLRSSWVAATGQTREDTRLTMMGATTPVNPLQVRSGILPGSYDGQSRLSGFWMEGGSGTMTATVHEGRAVVQAGPTQGAYPVTLPDPTPLTFADGDAANNRIDLVVLRIYDAQYDQGSSLTQASLEIVRGTPAPAPVVPAVGGIGLPLYQVTVRAGASAGKGGVNWGTADVIDLRNPTVAVGGILPAVGDNSNGAYPGQYRDSGGALQRWDGSAWVSYPSAMGGIAPSGTITNASYTGQYRDSGGTLQRWTGSTWVTYQPVTNWTNYTPVWRAENGAAPVIGNGTLAGSYAKIGTIVHVRVYLEIGTTTNLATQDANANWTFSLPFTPVVSPGWKASGWFINAAAFDSAGNRLTLGSAQLQPSNGVSVIRGIRDPGTAPIWDKSAPFAWSTGASLSLHGTYESTS